MPATLSKRPATSAACALTSCTPYNRPPPFGPRPRSPGRCRADAVQVERDETEHEKPPMTTSPATDPLAQDFVQVRGRCRACCASANSRPRPAAVAVLLQRRPVRRRRQAGPPRGILCTPPAGVRACTQFDMLFGPAYKGITLAAAVAIELARLGRNVPFAYNRKEAKDHGEGGTLVGAKVAGRVLIVDDVISAGTSVRESIAMIQAAGAPRGVAIALDRPGEGHRERRDAPWSAVQYVQQRCPAGGGDRDAFRLAAILSIQRRRRPPGLMSRRFPPTENLRSLTARPGPTAGSHAPAAPPSRLRPRSAGAGAAGRGRSTAARSTAITVRLIARFPSAPREQRMLNSDGSTRGHAPPDADLRRARREEAEAAGGRAGARPAGRGDPARPQPAGAIPEPEGARQRRAKRRWTACAPASKGHRTAPRPPWRRSASR